MQAPGNSYGSKSLQTGPGHSQIFKALLKIGFHSPISFSIQFSFSTAPHPHYFSLNWNASHHCFNIPRQACHLLYICILQATASNQKDWAPYVLLSTEGGKSKKKHVKRRSPAADKPPQNGCEAEGGVWEYSSGPVVLQHRRHCGSLTHEGYLGLRAFREVNVPLQLPERTTFVIKSVLQWDGPRRIL